MKSTQKSKALDQIGEMFFSGWNIISDAAKESVSDKEYDETAEIVIGLCANIMTLLKTARGANEMKKAEFEKALAVAKAFEEYVLGNVGDGEEETEGAKTAELVTSYHHLKAGDLVRINNTGIIGEVAEIYIGEALDDDCIGMVYEMRDGRRVLEVLSELDVTPLHEIEE